MGMVKENKMAGPDEIGRKDVKNFDNMGIDKITEIINKVYNSNKILKEINFHSSTKESRCFNLNFIEQSTW